MKKLLLMFVFGSFYSSVAIAADPTEEWLTKQNQRGTEIELIRVANEKHLVATEETDQEVASILEEVEAIEKDASDYEEVEASL